MDRKKLNENNSIEMRRKVSHSPTRGAGATAAPPSTTIKDNQQGVKKTGGGGTSGSSPYQGKIVGKKKNEKSVVGGAEVSGDSRMTAGAVAGKKKPVAGNCPAATGAQTKKNSNSEAAHDPRTLLYISGGRLEDGETELEFVDTILNRRMKFSFQTQQVLKCVTDQKSMNQSDSRNQQINSLTLVAVLPTPECVQEVLKNVQNFKKMVSQKPDLEHRYGELQFEEFLTDEELLVKAELDKRVKELNDRMESLMKIFGPVPKNGVWTIPPEFEWARAVIKSKNSFTHLGYEYQGKILKTGANSTHNKILWTSSGGGAVSKVVDADGGIFDNGSQPMEAKGSIRRKPGNGGKSLKKEVQGKVEDFETKKGHEVDPDAGILF